MDTHPTDDDMVQMNTVVRRSVKKEISDAAWRRRLSTRQLVQQILEAWLEQEREKGTDGAESGESS